MFLHTTTTCADAALHWFVTHDPLEWLDLTVTFFAAEPRHSLARTKLYCSVTEARCPELPGPESLHGNINNNNTYDSATSFLSKMYSRSTVSLVRE